MIPTNHISTIAGILAIVMWSITITISRSLSEKLGPTTAALSIFIFASAASFITLTNPKERKKTLQLPKKYLIICGLLFIAHNSTLFLAVGFSTSMEQVLHVTILNYLWPFFTLLFVYFILKRPANLLLLFVSSGIVLSGLFIVLNFSSTQVTTLERSISKLLQQPIPYILALGAAACWGLYSALTQHWTTTQSSSGVSIFFPGTTLVFYLIYLTSNEVSIWSNQAIIEMISLGTATYLAYWCWDKAMQQGNIVMLGTLSYFIPALSILATSLYLSVSINNYFWSGCGIMILGSYLSKTSFKYVPDKT